MFYIIIIFLKIKININGPYFAVKFTRMHVIGETKGKELAESTC